MTIVVTILLPLDYVPGIHIHTQMHEPVHVLVCLLGPVYSTNCTPTYTYAPCLHVDVAQFAVHKCSRMHWLEYIQLTYDRISFSHCRAHNVYRASIFGAGAQAFAIGGCV